MNLNLIVYKYINLFIYLIIFDKIYFGDWGLGIGDWAYSPIPNPQSPIVYFFMQ